MQSPLRLCCNILRRELAITRLDWSFAPFPRSEKRIAYQYSFRLPSGFRLTSPCPGKDHLISSLTLVTPGPLRPSTSPDNRLRAFWFPFAYGLLTLRLATKVNSPARDSKRNMQPWSTSFITMRHHIFFQEVSFLLGCKRL